MSITRHWWLLRYAAGIGLLLSTLIGCGQKPPNCVDPQLGPLAKSILVDDQMKELIRLVESRTPLSAQENMVGYKKRMADFTSAVQVSMKDIVSNGYDSEARRYSCAAEFVLVFPTAQKASARRDFYVQGTAEKDGKFLLSINGIDAFTKAVVVESQTYEIQKLTQEEKNRAAPKPSSCVQERVAAWRKTWDDRQHALMDEAEREKREFRPMPIPQMEQEEEAATRKAENECG